MKLHSALLPHIYKWDAALVESGLRTCPHNFLTNYGRALLGIAHDAKVRLRDVASRLGVIQGRAYGIGWDLTEANYVITRDSGWRIRYQIQEHRSLPDALGREQAIGEVLGLCWCGECTIGRSRRTNTEVHSLRILQDSPSCPKRSRIGSIRSSDKSNTSLRRDGLNLSANSS